MEVGVKVRCVRVGGGGGLKVRRVGAGDGGGCGGEVCEGWFVVVPDPTLAVRS